jgi:hypothetical protein
MTKNSDRLDCQTLPTLELASPHDPSLSLGRRNRVRPSARARIAADECDSGSVDFVQVEAVRWVAEDSFPRVLEVRLTDVADPLIQDPAEYVADERGLSRRQ